MSDTALEPARRGTLVLARGVVEKIAGQAAREVTSVGGVQRGLLGLGGHADLAARPRAEVHLTGTSAEIRLRLAVAYPTSIREATDAVRTAVTERVGALCGVTVNRVDIEVSALPAVQQRGGLR